MKKLFSGMLLVSLVWTNTWAEKPENLLQTKLNALRTMSAQFDQLVKAKHKDVSHSTGSMALERPGRFRWQTQSPMEQLVVADGKKMWIYDVDLEQVTVKKQEKGMGGTAALFLSGYDDNITRDFNVTQSSEGKADIFDLQPKSSKENFQHIKLIFVADKLTGLELHDQLGQITVVKLQQIKSNSKLSAQLFQFKPPKGVDIVQQ